MCQILVDKMRIDAYIRRCSCRRVDQSNDDLQSTKGGLNQGSGEWGAQLISERSPRNSIKAGLRQPKITKLDEAIWGYECLKMCCILFDIIL